jgi:hypothetical protein
MKKNHSLNFNFDKSLIKSSVLLEKGEYDNISEKHYFSLIIYGYNCLEFFSYLFKNEKVNINYLNRLFSINKYENIKKYLMANSSDNSTKSVYIFFRREIWVKNNDKINTKMIRKIFIKNP